jgi:hypothetical protein
VRAGAKIISVGLAALALASCDNHQAGNAPRDDDPNLRRLVQEAMPITRGLEGCRAAYGSFPPNPEATIGCLPRNTPGVRQGHFVAVGEWLISPDSTGVGYTLTRHLEGKAMLMRHCANKNCRWIYDPGNGREALTLKLDGSA